MYLLSGRQNDWCNILIGWPLELADDLGQLTVRTGGINDPEMIKQQHQDQLRYKFTNYNTRLKRHFIDHTNFDL